MAWRVAKSLGTLRSQVNALAPNRSKASDGVKGDDAHAARKSDHNPDANGIVHAFDLTHDPKNGVDIQKVCDAIVASKDRRVSYLICNGTIVSGNAGPKPWVKRKYTGANKHTKHLHVSVLDAYQDDTAPWKIDGAFKAVAATKPAPAKPAPAKPTPSTAITDKATVLGVQMRLRDLGYTEVGTPDGRIGKLTTTAILAFRLEHDLPLKPEIDAKLIDALDKASPRALAAARVEATPAEVRAVVPEVKANFLSQIWGWILGVPAAVGAVGSAAMDAIPAAKETLEPITSSVSPWVWLGAVAVVAVIIVLVARKGEAAGVAAVQDGSRR